MILPIHNRDGAKLVIAGNLIIQGDSSSVVSDMHEGHLVLGSHQWLSQGGQGARVRASFAKG